MLRNISVHASILFVLLFLPLSLSHLTAQTDSGIVSGLAVDQSGALVSDATVTLTNTGTNAERTVTTNHSGEYTFPPVAAGIYTVRADAPGFQRFEARVEVTVGGHATVPIKFALSGSQQTVTVIDQGGTTVNTQTQEVSQIVSSVQVSELPSLTRNPYDFVSISGNISSGDKVAQSGATKTTGDQNDTTRGVGYSLNGQRSSGTEILLDGVENVDSYVTGPEVTVPIDAVQEYRITTSNFEPQYGRASGGVVSVVTKSGTNRFHGGAWEFNRLAAYTANTVQNAQSGVPKGGYTRNQFGYDVGGPILKDRLFFFQSTEWVRVRSSANQISLVPTPQFLAASDSATQAFFAQYGSPAPAFTQTLSKDNVVASGVTPTPGGPFDLLPGNTPVLGIAPFASPTNAGGGDPQNTYYLIGRVDFNATPRTQMYGRYVFYNELDETGAMFSSPYSQYNVGASERDNAALFGLTHEFSGSLVSSTKLSFTRHTLSQPFDTSQQNAPTLFLYNNATIGGNLVQFPGFYSQFEGTGGLPSGGPQNTVQISQDIDWTKGQHSFKAGTQLLYIQNNITYGAYAQAVEGIGTSAPTGLDNFLNGTLSIFEGAVDPQGALPCVRNYATGNLIQTPQCQITLPASQPNFARSDRFKDWAVYAQDAWKLTPRFTLNYGVRYEYYGIQHNNKQDLDANFYYGPGASLQAQIRSGQVFTVPDSPIGKLWNPQYGTVGPRVGFAYDINGNGKTSLRGGYGVAYERNFGNITFNVIQNPPNYAVVQITTPSPITTNNAGPIGGSSGTVPLPPTSLRNVDENIRTAATQFYSLTVERQLANNVVASIAYVGSRGTHLYDVKGYNMLGAGNVYLGDPVQDASGNFIYSRLNNQYGSINNRGSAGDSYYNGLNIGFQMTDLERTGLIITANYTVAHSTDNLSSTFSESNSSVNGIGNLGYLDPFNPGLDHGASDFDIRQRFVLAPIYRTQWFKDSHSFAGRLLGGYEVTGIYTVRTGTPFSVSDSSNSLNRSAGVGIPRYTPGTTISNYSFTKAIDKNASGANLYDLVSLPAAVSYGNQALGGISDFGPYPAAMTHRNAFSGPGAWNFDLAASKNIPVREGIEVELRAEGFDIFNHHNLYITESNNDVANYGYDGATIPIQAKKGGVNGGANDERRFGQFALKIKF
ncbi:TonB-dependent receptor [Tunturibacter psychrotolerans]|uniref:TonB-dependent receptor n=1 Tax=Tunturiibacter psychrotolerans TaxID=3069686 RepID=A0AAU7ZUS0_9BACT